MGLFDYNENDLNLECSLLIDTIYYNIKLHYISELHSECNFFDALDLIADDLIPEFKLTERITPYDYKELNIDYGECL